LNCDEVSTLVIRDWISTEGVGYLQHGFIPLVRQTKPASPPQDSSVVCGAKAVEVWFVGFVEFALIIEFREGDFGKLAAVEGTTRDAT